MASSSPTVRSPSQTNTRRVPGAAVRTTALISRRRRVALSTRTASAPSAGKPPSPTPSAADCRIDWGEATERAEVFGILGSTGADGAASSPGSSSTPQRKGSACTPGKVDQPMRDWPVRSWVSES